MMMYVMNKKQADSIAGTYGGCFCISPIKISATKYCLPADVLEKPELAHLSNLFVNIPIDEIEVTDEDT